MMQIFRSAALAVLLCSSALSAAEQPRDLAWGAMIGPAIPAQNAKPKSALTNAQQFEAIGAKASTPGRQDQWMSAQSIQYDTAAPYAVVPELDGERVRIGGYVVPLDFDGLNVREFLLVPYVGACLHVPAPPANQIVYVKSGQPFPVKADFDPVYVTGRINTVHLSTGIAVTGYTMEAETVEFRKE